jgi:hypothetical protein
MSSRNPQKATEKISVWAADLSWGSLPGILRLYLRCGPFPLRFTKISQSFSYFVRTLTALHLLKTESGFVNYIGHGEHVDAPDSEAFQIQALKNQFADLFSKKYAPLLSAAPYPDSRAAPARVFANLKMAAATHIYELLEFVAFARYWHRSQGVAPGTLVILSHHAILANTVPAGWAGPDVRFMNSRSKKQSLFGRLGLQLWVFVCQAWRRKRPAPSGPFKVASTAHFYGLDRTAAINDLHWWWQSGISADRLIFCFDHPYRTATQKIVRQAEALGVRCVVLRRNCAGDCPNLLWKPAPGPWTATVRFWWAVKTILWGAGRSGVRRWITCRMLDMLNMSQRLEDFMQEFNVRVFFHYQDDTIDYVSLACDAVGGIRIGDEWSHHHWPSASQLRLHHLYFAWGPYYATVLKLIGSCVDHLLLSGCTIKGSHPAADAPEEVQKAATALRSHGATRILALFDTSLPCADFYRFFLDHLVQDSRWGLLIKSKRPVIPPWVTTYDDEVKRLYEKAVPTGRVVMLPGNLSPAEVAAGAHISVGVDVNSAIVVAALAGRRAIHLDYVGLHLSPIKEWAMFYRAGPDRLVFDDPNKLWTELNRFYDEPDATRDLGLAGDHVLRHIDPFRDGAASQRIGEYLFWYLGGLDQGLDREAALQEASRRYAKKWGRDKVVLGLGAEEPFEFIPTQEVINS